MTGVGDRVRIPGDGRWWEIVAQQGEQFVIRAEDGSDVLLVPMTRVRISAHRGGGVARWLRRVV